MRRLPGRRAGRDGRAGSVGRHAAHRLDRPRVPAGGARLLGEGLDAVLSGDRQHTVLRLGPAHPPAGRAAGEPGAAVDRPGAHAVGVLRPGADAGHAGEAAGRRRGE